MHAPVNIDFGVSLRVKCEIFLKFSGFVKFFKKQRKSVVRLLCIFSRMFFVPKLKFIKTIAKEAYYFYCFSKNIA